MLFRSRFAVTVDCFSEELQRASPIRVGSPRRVADVGDCELEGREGSRASAGEETGKLPEMLSNVADFYENEVNVMADMLASLLEPIFIVGVGTTIGVIVIAMYLPIFQLGRVLS